MGKFGRKNKEPATITSTMPAKKKGGGVRKPKRVLVLGLRTVLITNLNFSPEIAGDKLVERADLSLEVLLEKDDIPGIVLVRGNPLQVLWDKNGEPQLRELGKLALDLKIDGTARFGLASGDEEDMMSFEGAVLKKVAIEPMLGFKATMRCQVRVNPAMHLEELASLVIERKGAFSFEGHGTQASEPDPQEKLAV